MYLFHHHTVNYYNPCARSRELRTTENVYKIIIFKLSSIICLKYDQHLL